MQVQKQVLLYAILKSLGDGHNITPSICIMTACSYATAHLHPLYEHVLRLPADPSP